MVEVHRQVDTAVYDQVATTPELHRVAASGFGNGEHVALPPLEQYQQDFLVFSNSWLSVLEEEGLAIDSREREALRANDQRLIFFKTQLERARDLRGQTQAQRDSVRERYKCDYDKPKAVFYRVFKASHLGFIAEKIIPLNSTEKDFQNAEEDLLAVKDRIGVVTDKRTIMRNAFSAQKLDLAQRKLRAVEEWVVSDVDRVLVYAFQNPTRAERIFGLFAEKSENSVETLRYLRQEFGKMNGNGAEAVSAPKPQKVKTRSAAEVNSVDNSNGQASDQLQVQSGEKKEVNEPYAVARVVNSLGLGEHLRKVQVLDEEGLNIFLRRSANKIARNDSRLFGDIVNMVSYLQANPYGDGVEMLTREGASITFGHDKFRLWHLIPDKTGGAFTFAHKLSHDIRVVYTVINNDRIKNTVALLGVYPHDEFKRRFGNAT